MTVTPDNLDEMAAVSRWVASNADAFRIVSFQPSASVGRTLEDHREKPSLDEVWRKVCEGLGSHLNQRSILFGHPSCHVIAPLVILKAGKEIRVVELARSGKAWDRSFFDRVLDRLGGFSSVGSSAAVLTSRLLSLAIRNLPLLVEAVPYGIYRLWGERRSASWMLCALVRGQWIRVRPILFVIHRFMDEEELTSEEGAERLEGCVFKVPVGDRMVSMCEVNATPLRRELNEEARGRLVLEGE